MAGPGQVAAVAAGLTRLGFATYLAPSVLPVYRAVAAEVGRRLGIDTELVVETSYAAFERDEHEVSFVCSRPYVLLERSGVAPAVPVAAPVLRGNRYAGRPISFSDVIVRSDSPFRTFADLRGLRWAYSDALSHAGYGITLHHLVRMGETEGFFGEVVEAGFHRDSIEMVVRGEVDAAAVDSQVLEIAFRAAPALAENVRVIESLGPSTSHPVAVSRRVPSDVRAAIGDALVSLGEDAVMRAQLAVGLVERFVRVDERGYDDIRAMADACERAGLTRLR